MKPPTEKQKNAREKLQFTFGMVTSISCIAGSLILTITHPLYFLILIGTVLLLWISYLLKEAYWD